MDRYHNSKDIDEISSILSEILKEHYINPESKPVTPAPDKNYFIKKYHNEEMPGEGIGLSKALELFRDQILKDSVKTWHPHFMNQMFPGASFPSVVGDMMASMMNPTLATWEISPAATLIEKNVASWMANILGMPKGSSGIFLPGGSLANLIALTVARNNILGPGTASKGIDYSKKPVILCSETAHYSIGNAANLLGIGIDNIIKIATNERNEILLEDFVNKLEFCEREGLTPFAVVAIIGSTVTGGVDPIRQMAEICKGKNIHFHVDAAFGGGLALTTRKEIALDGVELADSICWDAHKWFHSSLTTTLLAFPDMSILKETFDSNADYLFHGTGESDEATDDLGRYTLLCGKRFDALKIWLLWKSYGTDELKKIAESRIQLATDFYQVLNEDNDFQPDFEPVAPIMCFKYLPQNLRGQNIEYLDNMHRWIREQIKIEQIAFFNHAQLNGSVHFRMVLVNPLTKIEHLQMILGEIKKKGQEFIKLYPIEN